ncbi:MAG TPA: hypothetical protein ENF81_00320 [Thermotogaceae bacterium]|nr:hypothetical protein [Thermotogaceae bacterium]
MYLGIDIGTTRLKMNVVDTTGKILIEDSEKLVPSFGRNGEAEIDPLKWINGIKKLLKKYDLKSIEAIGLSGQMHTLILLDRDFQPVRRAILWADARGYEEVEFLSSSYSESILRHCGSLPSNAFTLIKLMYLLKNEPQSIRNTYKFCLSKDFVGGWLTGNFNTDFTDASATLMLDIQKREWYWSLLEDLNIPKEIFPEIHGSLEIRGYLRENVANYLGLRAGIPVVYGAGDQEAAAFGVGVTRPKDVMFSISTGSQIVVPVAEMIIDSRIHNFRHVEGLHIMGAVQNAGLALEWAVERFGFKDMDELTNEAFKSPVGANGVVFLPYITPERTPVMKENITCGIFGLKSGNSRADMARAILEGITFCVYDAWKCVEEVLSLDDPEVVILGGVSKNPIIIDTLLNLMNANIKLLDENFDPSSFGAALMAGKVNEAFKNFNEIVGKRIVKTRVAHKKDEYFEKYENFLKVRKHILDV